MPPNAKIGQVHWAPDGARFAFSVTETNGIEVWMAGVDTAEAKVVDGVCLNKVFGGSLIWMPDSQGILVRTVCRDRGDAPEASRVPEGPVIQENVGKLAPSRTYQDLLKKTTKIFNIF